MIPTPSPVIRTLPSLTGLAKFQTTNEVKTTYTNDFRKRRNLEFILDDIPTLRVRRTASVSKSTDDLRTNYSENEFNSKSARLAPLYHEDRGKLRKLFEARKVNGVDYFRSHFDHNDVAREKQLMNKTLYEVDFTPYSHAARFPQIKRDRFFQTTGSRNVKFLKSNSGIIYHFG
jgi:hypothetical protein